MSTQFKDTNKDAIRVDSGVEMKRTNMAKGCLYCGLQLPDTAEFCPQCGRPIERAFRIRPIYAHPGQARQ